MLDSVKTTTDGTTEASTGSHSKESLLFSNLEFSNRFHSLGEDFFSVQEPDGLQKPELVHINHSAALLLDHDSRQLDTERFCQFVAGLHIPKNCQPVAAIYAGHQFGGFVPQLGDGRALLIGEVKNSRSEYWEIQLKGAGMTPYSRRGDGRAVLRSTIREYLCSEAMHGLGIPTTRALAMVNSEEEVYREQLETGASMVRMAPSFIRFGSFELFASRNQPDKVQQLADFVIENYYPETSLQDKNGVNNPYQQFLSAVVEKTALMIAHWQSAGFAHGVMNTDNMSILGLTLDYGPFGFLDTYNRDFVCNHSDHQGRYSFKNQPSIALWNLTRFAETLLSLMTIDEAKAALAEFEPAFTHHYLSLMEQKLGFFNADVSNEEHRKRSTLILSLLNLMEKSQVDYTLLFRQLAIATGYQEKAPVRDMFMDREAFDTWHKHYHKLLEQDESLCPEQRRKKMNRVNPKYILRNYMAQVAIEQATRYRDYSEVDKLMNILLNPYDEHPDMEHYAGLPPDWATQISVSCSS